MKEPVKETPTFEKELLKLNSHQLTTDNIRAVEEIRTAMIVAQKFPRKELIAEDKILEACKRLPFAKTAFYSYPRGGVTVTGPTIHLARMLGRYWGNLHYGVSELEQYDDYTQAEAYCWDLESNVRIFQKFNVKHERSVNNKNDKNAPKIIKKLDDSRDIYELIANMGARRLRNCILHAIPAHITERAKDACRKTLEYGDGVPMVDRISLMLKVFKDNYQVSSEMIEKFLQHKVEAISAVELITLQGICNAFRDGQKRREDFFLITDENSEKKIEELNNLKAKLGGPK